MSKVKTFFALAVSMALLGLAQATSGFVLWLGFPSGGGGGGELTIWEISKHTWIDIHDWVAVALVALVIIHVILHWKWIFRMTKSLLKGVSKRLAMNTARTQLLP